MNEEPKQDGEIRYFESSGMNTIEAYLPGDKAADIWLALHGRIENWMYLEPGDPLSASERDLYESLNKRFIEDAILPMTYETRILEPE